jgi:hypothetical protein
LTENDFVFAAGTFSGLPFGRNNGTKERPFDLIVHKNAERSLAEGGVREGDIVPLLGSSWWRIVFSGYIA